MFKRPAYRSLLSVVFAALFFAGISASQSSAAEKTPPPRDGKQQERFVAWMQKELGLTPTQTAQVREILKPDSLIQPPESFAKRPEHGKRGPGARPGMFPFNEEFLDQLKSDKVDTAALNRSFDQDRARMQARHDKMVFKFVQLHGVLTHAQRLKLADIVETRRAEYSEKAEKNSRKK